MAVPTWSEQPIVSDFLPPYDEPYDPQIEAVLGGDAIGDPVNGRGSKRWTISIDGGGLVIADDSGEVRYTVAAPGANTCSLAFDSNMAVACTWTTSTGATLYYYDSLVEDFNTMTITGATSARVGVDDYRKFREGVSDVLWFYTLDSSLYVRVQRERYLIPHRVGGSGASLLVKAGPNTQYRFQVRLEKPEES